MASSFENVYLIVPVCLGVIEFLTESVRFVGKAPRLQRLVMALGSAPLESVWTCMALAVGKAAVDVRIILSFADSLHSRSKLYTSS